MDNCVGVEDDMLEKVPDRVGASLESVWVADIMAKLEIEGSLPALEDLVIWTALVSLVDVNADKVCENAGGKLRLFDSAGLWAMVTNEKAECVDRMLVGENKNIDCEGWLLNWAEIGGLVADEDADNIEGITVKDEDTDCDVEINVALAGNRVVDVLVVKTAELVKELAEVSVVEEAKPVELSGAEVATDCCVEVVDGATGSDEVASIDESAIVDKIAIVEEDVGTALVEIATPKDEPRSVDKAVAIEVVVGTVLEERSSALMMSAAFARVLDSCSHQIGIEFHTFSATPYTTACKCAAGITGKIPASTTLRFCVPDPIPESAFLL